MKTWQRRLGIGVVGFLGVVVLLLGGAYGMSASAVGPGHEVEPHPFNAAIGDAVEGARLGDLYGCSHCHTPDLGGMLFLDEMPFARLSAPNLTAGAPGGAFSDEEFERALRHGIGRDGRKLFIMPSAEYTYLSDQDIADLVAWIRELPAVERALPVRTFGPVGRTMVALGKVPSQADMIAADPNARHLERPAADNLLELGHYYTRLCIGCHGLDLAGGLPLNPDVPAGPDLTPAGPLRNYSWDDFTTMLATGRTPDGRDLDPEVMPWTAFGSAEPHEIEAIWTYLRALPAE